MTDLHPRPPAPGGYLPFAPYGSYRDAVPIDRPRPPRWYRPGHSLVGAATFAAVWTWLALPAGMAAAWAFRAFAGGWLIFAPFQWGPVLLAFAVHVFALRGVIATVKPAVAWFRDPARSVAGGLALAHALAALVVLVASWW